MTLAAKIYNKQITEPSFCKFTAQEIMLFTITTMKMRNIMMIAVVKTRVVNDGDDACIVDWSDAG